MRIGVMAALAALVLPQAPATGQVKTEVPDVVAGARPVTVERVKVRGDSLVGNLEVNAVDRHVLVFLPPTYAKEKGRRYPVVYALHGYLIDRLQSHVLPFFHRTLCVDKVCQ
jgi:hypothetical protein